MGIVLLATNPGLDRTVWVDRHEIGREHRARRTDLRAGGKAINVARALRQLGVPARVIAPVGGPTGEAMLELAAAEALEVVPVPCRGLTRSTTAVVDPAGVSVYNDSGFVLAPDEVARVVEALDLASGDRFVMAGSCPRGTPGETVRRLLAAGHDAGAQVIVDTSGAALAEALDARPSLAAPNVEEARAVLAQETGPLPMDSSEPLEGAMPLARALRHRGAGSVVLSAGRAGAVVADDEGIVTAAAPPVEVLNPVGAGDCLLAALLAGLREGAAPRDTLAWAVAVASASCEAFGAGDFDPARARELASGSVGQPR